MVSAKHLCLLAFVAACAQTSPKQKTAESTPMVPPTPSVVTTTTVASAAAPTATVVTPAPSAKTPEVLEGAQFATQAQTILRMAACTKQGPISKGMEAIVEKHCTGMEPIYGTYRKNWMEVAIPFIEKLRPKDLPKKVVYPFGGGDLLTALATYPDAEEFTILSLETAGDLRGIDKANANQLTSSLSMLRSHLSKLFDKVHSRTDNLWLESKSVLPGEIAFSMAALSLHEYNVDSLRYFEVKEDGSLHYFTDAEIAASDKTGAEGVRPPFHNVEIRFSKNGGPTRIARHFSANLDDDHLRNKPGLVAHLKSKGQFAAMTKAASHLLWSNSFSTIRDLLHAQMVWMISDTTCAPPRLASKAGFVQDTYGIYLGAEPFGLVNPPDIAAFIKLFKENPQRELPFRYGYPDNQSHGHMVITRKGP
jgi:hypothetical protein